MPEPQVREGVCGKGGGGGERITSTLLLEEGQFLLDTRHLLHRRTHVLLQRHFIHIMQT